MADEWFRFATPDHFWMQWRHRLVVRALEHAGTQVGRILEIGCGHGVAREMLERDLNIAVDGCDLNLAALELAKPGKGELFLYNILDQEPSLIGRYDAVLLLDVIEHIADERAFLEAASRHLRPGGVVIVNVPANMLLFSEYDTAAGHLRRYTPATVTELFSQCGIKEQRIEPWGMLMIPSLLVRKLLLRGTKRSGAIRTGFVPPNAMWRVLLQCVKNIETALPFSMPWGTSILAWGRLPV
jgi:2-polyprenyl-3-methyl-5-hydroxy-6-metoxy-1,4-benzoquinol methylase